MSARDMIPFQFDGHDIRVIHISGAPHIVAKDVAEALGYSWQANVIAHVPPEWKGINSINTLGGQQQMAVLSEQGLYFFLGRSDKSQALPFQKWIAGDVLPAIRSTGSYTAPNKRPSRAAQSLIADVRAIDFIGNMIAKVPGARLDVVAAIKLRMIEELTGLPATQFGGALPAEVLAKAVKLNPTEIGKRLSPRLSPVRINKLLIELGMQRKTESGHVLTEAGAAHGESRPFQAENHHVGDQINWYESAIHLIQAALLKPPDTPQGALL